jgi:hypothetical protein
VTLKAATVTEVDMWMEAIDCVCERQKLVDEVVVGSASVASVAAATVPKCSNVGCRTNEDSTTTTTTTTTATTTTTTDVMNCRRYSSTACPTETRLTTNHSFIQPNLLQSRSTLETLASSSDDSLDVFEECFDGHTNIIPISRQQHAATNNECHSNLNEDCGIDLMKAVDDLTRLSTTCYGGNLSEQSKPLVAGVKQHSKDNAMAKMGAGCESKKGNETSDDNNEPMLKLDPKYQKYYAMMKMGLPKQVAQHAMKRDQLDPRYVCDLREKITLYDRSNITIFVCIQHLGFGSGKVTEEPAGIERE